MKQAVAENTADILHKIETIEKDVMELKLTVLKKLAPSKKNIIKLGGIIKGVAINENDINKSIYLYLKGRTRKKGKLKDISIDSAKVEKAAKKAFGTTNIGENALHVNYIQRF